MRGRSWRTSARESFVVLVCSRSMCGARAGPSKAGQTSMPSSGWTSLATAGCERATIVVAVGCVHEPVERAAAHGRRQAGPVEEGCAAGASLPRLHLGSVGASWVAGRRALGRRPTIVRCDQIRLDRACPAVGARLSGGEALSVGPSRQGRRPDR